jgi:hypothetical protein
MNKSYVTLCNKKWPAHQPKILNLKKNLNENTMQFRIVRVINIKTYLGKYDMRQNGKQIRVLCVILP